MSTLSTHVLDTSIGKPAHGVRVELLRDGATMGSGVTDVDGRVRDLFFQGATLEPGEYQLKFGVAEYFAKSKRETFYSEISVTFRVTAGAEHYHVPLLVSPFGYSTYRGS